MKLYDFLDTEGTQTFAAIRKHLGIPKGCFFNFEKRDRNKDGDKTLLGNRTQHSMLKVFGRFWYEFTEGKQNQIIDNWRNSESDEALSLEIEDDLDAIADCIGVDSPRRAVALLLESRRSSGGSATPRCSIHCGRTSATTLASPL